MSNFILPVKVLVGERVFLECAANGVPLPSISWLKDGVNLHLGAGGRFTSTGNGSLAINKVPFYCDCETLCLYLFKSKLLYNALSSRLVTSRFGNLYNNFGISL